LFSLLFEERIRVRGNKRHCYSSVLEKQKREVK